MAWCLWRKPYPGLVGTEQIDILTDVVLVGRGMDCTVHCLSMFVSRQHLKLIPKDDGIYVTDLGSSNGTFVNQIKIGSNIEFLLKAGDEVGLGNVVNDNKDCFLYEVRQLPINEGLTSGHLSIQEKEKELTDDSLAARHTLQRGLKRFVQEPEIVTLDDDGGGDGSVVKTFPVSSKKLKVDKNVGSITGLGAKRTGETIIESKSENPPLKPLKDIEKNKSSVTKEVEMSTACNDPANTGNDEEDLFIEEMLNVSEEQDRGVSSIKIEQISKRQNLSRNLHLETKCESAYPSPIPSNITSKRSNVEGHLGKPLNDRLSVLLEGSCNASSGTLKIASPVPGGRSISSSFTSPTQSKCENPEYMKPALTSTPARLFKREDNCLPTSPSEACWSPITKDSSRYSQGSSANYTLDEEMVEIDLCNDDNDEVFPCSQMFAEEDVKPCVEVLEKEADIVNLSDEEKPQMNKMERDDDVVLISSGDEGDDEDEDCIEDANRWFMRLSQSSVKVEEEEPLHQDYDDNLLKQMSENCEKANVNFLSEMLWEDDHQDCDFNFELNKLKKDQVSNRTLKDTSKVLEKDHQKKKAPIDADGNAFVDLTDQPHTDEKLEVKDKEASKELQVDKFKEAPGKTPKETRVERSKDTQAAISKETKHRKRKDSRRERKKKDKYKEKSAKSKDIAAEHSSSKAERKSHKDRKSNERGDKNTSHHSKYDRKQKDSHAKDLLENLRKTFSDSSSEAEEPVKLLPANKMPYEEQAHSSFVSVPSKSDIEFDKLFMTFSDSKLKEKQVCVTLRRLGDDPQLCENYGVKLSALPSSSRPLPTALPKKSARKIELIDAPPNPPRKASNRGISAEAANKLFHSDRRKSTDDPKDKKSSHVLDPLALRREKLAKVAEKCASKNKMGSESKRAAPAKIKVTKSNRGSFLTEFDKHSPVSKPRSRKDILGNIKIPKIKDKTVTHLSAKSPLQALNLSWEKKSPTSTVMQPSNVIPVAVEIPTGCQPKKRIAQVPPPGFYEESKTLSVPLSTAPAKSCLSGSSKHNIAMNDPKPIAPKKRVRFKENIEEVFYIEKLPNTRSVRSYRDADRPKAIKPAAPVTPTKGPVVPTDDALLQDVIHDISKWNPLWLKEEKDLPPDIVPPVVSNMTLPALPKTEFLDFREYYDTMYPLLMLELWNGVSKEYNSHVNDARNNMIMAVDTASTTPVFSKADRMLTTLSCHMVVDKGWHADHPRLGSLVIIDLVLKDASEKLIISPVFGYVSFDSKDHLRNTDIFHKDLVPFCRNPTFKIRFCVMIRERKSYSFALERVMRIKHVKYIRGDLRMFQAMKHLAYMPLQYSIISPMAASEDFTLPDVSLKSLEFPDQLNPTQKKVVLQTAEVCLQDKPKICLIQGPPGTGKTQVIESLVMHLLYRDRMYSRANRERGLIPRILLCAPSNNATDLLVARLLRRRAKFEKEHRFKMVRVGQPQNEDVKGVSLQELANVTMKHEKAIYDMQGMEMDKGHWEAKLCAVENQIRDLQLNMKPIPPDLEFRLSDFGRRLRVLEERQKQQLHAPQTSSKQDFIIEREIKKKILRGADIIATTLNSCVVKVMETVFPPTNPGNYHFQVCIVDEATQCLEVETLIPLLLGVKTLVLVGDPNQLPATILSKIAREKGLGTSLFARLQNVVPKAIQLLDTQYRMHPEVLWWPNKFFYKCQLKSPNYMLSRRDSTIFPYTVLSLPFHQDPQGEFNVNEAKLVLELAELIMDEKVIQHEFRVGIVTPYQSQRRTFESMIERMPKRIKPLLEVNTIDSFQGQEKDIIIISCVRTSGVGFLSDRQRVNVAFTRAKYALIVCGNFSSLDRDSMWNNLLSDARQRNRFIEVRHHLNREDLWKCICKK